MYSNMALFPDASEMAKCNGASIRNVSLLSSFTASSTVAKLSSTYWVQMLIPMTDECRLDGNNRILSGIEIGHQTFSFIPSEVPMSYPAVMTLRILISNESCSPCPPLRSLDSSGEHVNIGF